MSVLLAQLSDGVSQHLDRAFFLPSLPAMEDMRHSFDQVVAVLDETIRRLHVDFAHSIDKVRAAHLFL